MPLWQRLVVTLIAMLAAGLLAGLVWRQLFGAPLPDYLGGLFGGLIAVPVWEFLKRVRPKG